MEFIYILILGVALSIDGFLTGIAYGVKGITLPLRSLLIVCINPAFSTAFAMFFAYKAIQYININFAITGGAFILITIGIFHLVKEAARKYHFSYLQITKYLPLEKDTLLGKFFFAILSEPLAADMDHSNSISSLEALFLGLALGLDNMVAIFAASLINPLPYYTPLVMGCIQLILIAAGRWLSAQFVTEKLEQNGLSYLLGLTLICLGLWRLK
ncbi:MAG: hypothetical protein H6Q67_209 [Firmicutes bacterium]|nr:hypothetical protein [Bacillota bacterium]